MLARLSHARPAAHFRALCAPARSMSWWRKIIPEDDPKLKEFKDKEAKAIKAQFARSKFADAAKAHTEKFYIAPPLVMAPSKENAFPALSLRPVQPGAGIDGLSIPSAFAAAPVTVVTVGFQAHSQAQLVPWTQHIVAALNPTPLPSYTPGVDSGVAFLNLVFLQGWVWKGLSGLVAGSTARALPPPVAAATALAVEPSAQTMDHICLQLHVQNRMQGQIFIVDSAGHVRWRAHGLPAIRSAPTDAAADGGAGGGADAGAGATGAGQPLPPQLQQLHQARQQAAGTLSVNELDNLTAAVELLLKHNSSGKGNKSSGTSNSKQQNSKSR